MTWHEPMHGETAKAFQAFCFYRDLGPTRSVTEAYRKYQTAQNRPLKGSTRANGHFKNWKKVFNWDTRVTAFDGFQRREKTRLAKMAWDEEIEARELDLKRRELAVGERLVERAEKMLNTPLYEETITRTVENEEGNTVEQHITISPAGWSFNTIYRLAQHGSRLQRLALGLDTDQQTVTLEEGGEEARAKDKLLSKLSGLLDAKEQ